MTDGERAEWIALIRSLTMRERVKWLAAERSRSWRSVREVMQ